MSSFRTFPAVLTALALAACGGGEPPAEEAPAVEVAAAPASPCYIANGSVDEARARPSPLSEVGFSVGGHQGTLCFGAPSANGRAIMGGLVPFGEAWRLGANEATAIHLTGPALVGGVQLEAGSYSLYAVPGAAEWTFFLNTNVNRWGIPVDDAVRSTEVGSFTAAVEATEALVETLTFRFEAGADAASGVLILEWESTRLRIPVAVGAAPAGV
jgi:hypothetical protein